MNRGNLYLLLWLGVSCFMLFQQQAMRTHMISGMKESQTPINKANWAYPKANDIFMLQDSSGLVNYLKIVERSGGDSLLVNRGLFTFHVELKGKSIYNKAWNYDFMKAEEMYINTFSYLSFAALTREKEAAHLTKSFQELTERQYPAALRFFYSPLIIILALIIFGLFILLFNFVNSKLHKRTAPPKSRLGVLIGFSLVTSLFAYLMINPFMFLVESDFLIVNILLFTQNFLIIFVGLLLFSFLKKKLQRFSSFSDKELIKFLSIMIGGFLLTTITAFLSAQIHSYLNIDYGFSNFNWMVLTAPYGPDKWFLFASANLIINFRKHFLQLRKEGRVVKLAQKRELDSKAELDGLQASVNPHFLYNSLNSIASLAQEDPAKTEEMTIALSTFYKYNTNRKEERWATISDEIEMLHSYLDIEKIRFGDRLQTKLEVEEACKSILIPRFLLQPLVENAIKYGYNSEANKISVSVIVKSNNNLLTFSIIDEGPPFSESLNDGYGLRMVQKKLRLLLPNRHRIEFLNEPIKEVRISIEL